MKLFLQILTIAIVGFLLGGQMAVWQGRYQRSSHNAPKVAEVGTVKSVPEKGSPAHIGGAFSLIDQTGAAVTEKSWPGQYKLVYFGYTHCADTCPATLQKIVGVLQQLDPLEASKIVPLFITVDPARDTVITMAEYLSRFHSQRLVGLTGSAAQIAGVQKAYHVYTGKKDGTESLDSHSAYVYLMSPDGKLLQVFDSDTSAQDLLVKIQKYVK